MPSLRQEEKNWKPNSRVYCRRIAEEFPQAVTLITFQGKEWVYDVDFQVLQDSLHPPVPPELVEYFRYARLREMLGLPDIPPEQSATNAKRTMEQIDATRIRTERDFHEPHWCSVDVSSQPDNCDNETQLW